MSNVNLRLLGLPKSLLQTLPNPTTKHAAIKTIDIPYAPEIIPQPELNQQQPRKFPYIAAKNPQDAAIACFQMLSQYFNIPLRRDMLRQVTAKQMAHTGSLSLQFCGAIRRQIGVVLQDTLLFDGTVRENIALASPDASDEEIIATAKVAFAHDFIMNLPNGYNTQVGERGSGLSGGQRQRIAIARTVLQNPQILILDEATSALDYNAEAEVCRNLATAFQGKTVFFITHRLSTIRSVDIILTMDSGVVVEQGTHEELMSRKGYYYCLSQQQEAQM
jgi:ABC-type bacteriocin/lantibiotic exporter with double-glycine peptidase domain